MSVTEGEPAAPPALVERVRGLILKPSLEFERIAAEPATLEGLYRNYLCILAAIAPAASLVHTIAFMHIGVFRALIAAAVGYGATLGLTYVMALVIETLAPNFGGAKDRIQALKVAVYAPTPALVAGVFQIAPILTIIGVLLSLQSLYLLWIGLPRLTDTPADKRGGFYAAVVVIMLGLWILTGFVMAALVGPALI